ncbi:S8 family serine peptidase [Kribbella sp. NPDC048915]|uniref:S8 family serine peptidase n=1 Tax=Kribbella sp. NPDC048915 TaxID=3155148 RepID=UPI0033C3388D
MRQRRRFSSVAVLSALAITASVLAAAPAASEPAAGKAVASSIEKPVEVTLVTGDVVTVTPVGGGRATATVRPGPGRDRIRFYTQELGGTLRVLPEDAVGPISSGVLDPELFEVDELAEQGYGGQVPLIVQYTDGIRPASALPGVTAVEELRSIGGAAVRTDADGAAKLWQSVAGGNRSALGGGIKKIWLDGKARADLHGTTAQIGAPTAWQSGYDGRGVDVAVLDTGVDSAHPDLVGKVGSAENFTDSPDAVDRIGHGTHVAATVAGTGAASNGSRRGVAPGANLLVGKVLNDDGWGYTSWVIAGMEWAAASGAEVVNLSLGGQPTDGTDPLSQAVNRISAESGTLFVVAAGNSGGEGTVGAPGAADAALTVGAVDRDEALAYFSSRGPRRGDHAIKPEVTAPGVGVVAARAAGTSEGDPVDEQYTAFSGTSMATPHVAGAAAILAQRYPGLRGPALKDLITSTAEHNDGLTLDEQGVGRVAVSRAVQQSAYATGTLNFGVAELPDPQPVTEQVSLTNTGDAALTLNLELQLTNLVTKQPHEGNFSLGAQQVTVPPRSAVQVPVTLDPTGLERGRYGGWIVARATDGTTLRTAVSTTVRGRLHEVTLRMRGRDGELMGTPFIGLFGDTQDKTAIGFIRHQEREIGVTLTVEEGTYLLLAQGLDGAPLDEQATLLTDPHFEVKSDRKLDLELRTGTPVRIETPKPAEHQAVMTYGVQRRHPNGYGVSFGTMEFSTTTALNVSPTRPVTSGTFEFWSRWQLVAPMVQVSGRGLTGTEDINLLHTSPAWDGRRKLELVSAGTGRPEELAAARVRGKAVLLRAIVPFDFEAEDQQIRNAAAAGAAAVLIQRPADHSAWTVWEPLGQRLPLPAFVVMHDDAERMLAQLRKRPITMDLTLTTSSPYLYDVVHVEKQQIPKQVVHRVTKQNTAQVEARYANPGGTNWSKEQRFAWRPYQDFAMMLERQRFIETPKVRQEWISANDTTWQQHVVFFFPDLDFASLRGATHVPRTYKPRETATENWFVPVVRPAAPSGPNGPVSVRDGDRLDFQVPEFVDSTGHYQAAMVGDTDTVSARLFRDGKLLTELPDAHGSVTVDPDDASYRLELETGRQQEDEWLWGGRTTTAWEFRSKRTSKTAVLPMLQVDYAAPVDLEGRANGHVPHLLGLSVRNQPGLPAPKGVTVRVDVSFDDGRTWRQAQVIGKGSNVKALVPAGKDAVTLRVRATDKAGNAVDQTVHRAYGLR